MRHYTTSEVRESLRGNKDLGLFLTGIHVKVFSKPILKGSLHLDDSECLARYDGVSDAALNQINYYVDMAKDRPLNFDGDQVLEVVRRYLLIDSKNSKALVKDTLQRA